jgi:hypothetical protein
MAPTNRERFLKRHGLPTDSGLNLVEISKLSGMPKRALEAVYERGMAAYFTNPTSVRLKGTFEKNVVAPMSQKLSAQQWAMGRVYAFVMKTPKVFYGADKDIAERFDLL